MSAVTTKALFRCWLGASLVVLALPLLSMVALSFNESRYGTLPFHFSTRWYSQLASDAPLLEALRASLVLATEVTVLTVVIGTMLSFGMAKARLWVNVPINGLLLALLTVPSVILSTGMLVVLSSVGLGQSVPSLLLASVVTALPFVVLVVNGRLQGLSDSYSEAARSLGAGPVRCFLTVTAPLCASAILAGAVLSFVMTFNNFAIQLFIAPLGLSTLPVQIYSMVRLGVTPDVNALGVIIVASTVSLILVLNVLTGSAARLVSSNGKAR